MAKLIADANFMHKEDDDYQQEFTEKFDIYSREVRDTITLQEVVACFKAAQDKICRPDFPPEGSSGYYMGYHLINSLTGFAGDLIDDDKAKPGDFHELYLEFIMAMIHVGPATSHIEYINILSGDSDTSFEEYFQGLRGEALHRIVRALKKDYHPDPGMEWSDFENKFEDFVRGFVTEAFSEEQFEDAHADFLELYMFFNLQFKDSVPEKRKRMHYAAYLIDLKYDRKIFKGLQDISLLKRHFQELSDLILAPEFPQDEELAKEVKDDLSSILTVVNEEDLIVDMYEAIMDLALNLTIKKAGCEDTREFFEAIGYFFYHISENSVKDNGVLFEGLVKAFIHVLHNVKDEVYLNYRFVGAVMYDCLRIAMGTSEEEVVQWIEMIKAMLRHSVPKCIEAAHRAMREKEKQIKWKKHPEELKAIFALMSKITFPKWLTEKEMETAMEKLRKLADDFLDEAKKVGIVKLELTGPILQFVFHCLEMRNEEFYDLAQVMADKIEYNPKKDKELMMQTLNRVTAMLEDDSYDWEEGDHIDLVCAVHDLVVNVFDCVKDGKMFTWDEYDDMIYLAKMCQHKMLHSTHDEPLRCAHYRVYVNTSMKVGTWLTTMNESHRLIPLIPGMVQLLESECKNYIEIVMSAMMVISNHAGNLFSPYLARLIKFFLETENDSALFVIWKSYEFNPAPMEQYFDSLFEHVDSGNSSVRSYILQLLTAVGKHQPQLFTEEKIKVLMKEAKEDQDQQASIVMIMVEVARRHIALFDSFIDDFMKPDLWQTMSTYNVVIILQLYALDSEEKANKIINYLMQRITSSKDHAEIVYCLNALRLIGFKHRPAIEKHRDAIEQFKDSTTNNDHHTCSANILDMLDGKSLDKIAEDLRTVQGDVADLDVRVTAAEKDIVDVKEDLQRHDDDIGNVKNDLSEQGQRLDKVEDTVDDTVAKVQEIDGKTLSHAPYWARDVSKLLNIEVDNDWRLLSLRLGFTNDDIRAWSQQADPCMAMLNEWYSTHKTREATHAVLTSLQLLDREDAAVIVENAMKNAEAVVEDTDFEYATPPDIFISYQWGHQAEVRLLRQHLEMAGFSCWMDVGQMGGGDKLFEKIDTGIRGAKMLISCVSGKYAKSPNCNREVNLAVSLGKPIIPLLMEKMSWPPPGSMGPIFSEYLFIRFFQRGGEETTDQRYWPLPKFQELLMQLAQIGVKPDERVVQPEYKDWWLPQVEEVTVDKDRAKKQSGNNSAPAADEKAAESPDIFISYQWGKQPQILKLYKKLTSLGYSCWLDIMQMGGGDSLYDKIDRGLRGCKIVLSSVTTKYAKSANCRREVSLADALQKPLVPLLLETMTWPPPGPMAPILTQLLYVNCTRDNMEETWTGPKFDEILAAIHQHVPSVPGEEEKQEKGAGDAGKKEKENKKEMKERENKDIKQAESAPPPPKPAAAVVQKKDESKPVVKEEPPASQKANTAADNTDGSNGGSTSSLKKEQTPPQPGTVERKHSQVNSLYSELGHDEINSGAQHLASSGLMHGGGQPKSACCSIL